ncbi:hypothetical protein L0152_31330, partial [bacterium]|nr:hypothetical protein [bacterium]
MLQSTTVYPAADAFKNVLIGYLTDVRGNGMEARLIAVDGDKRTIRIDDQEILIGQIGSYVTVRQNHINILALIFRDTEHNGPKTDLPTCGDTVMYRTVSL